MNVRSASLNCVRRGLHPRQIGSREAVWAVFIRHRITFDFIVTNGPQDAGVAAMLLVSTSVHPTFSVFSIAALALNSPISAPIEGGRSGVTPDYTRFRLGSGHAAKVQAPTMS